MFLLRLFCLQKTLSSWNMFVTVKGNSLEIIFQCEIGNKNNCVFCAKFQVSSSSVMYRKYQLQSYKCTSQVLHSSAIQKSYIYKCKGGRERNKVERDYLQIQYLYKMNIHYWYL